MSTYRALPIVPCPCGSSEPYWHGPEDGRREYCCDACWKVRGSKVIRDPVVSECGCGLKYTASGWAKLKLLGIQRLDPQDPALELRNCSCGSTLAIELP